MASYGTLSFGIRVSTGSLMVAAPKWNSTKSSLLTLGIVVLSLFLQLLYCSSLSASATDRKIAFVIAHSRILKFVELESPPCQQNSFNSYATKVSSSLAVWEKLIHGGRLVYSIQSFESNMVKCIGPGCECKVLQLTHVYFFRPFKKNRLRWGCVFLSLLCLREFNDGTPCSL